jgi:hypothetical protein
MIVPPFITKATVSSVWTLASGSPSTAIRSAYIPGATLPTLLDRPSSSAASDVAERIARAGVRPYLTM